MWTKSKYIIYAMVIASLLMPTLLNVDYVPLVDATTTVNCYLTKNTTVYNGEDFWISGYFNPTEALGTVKISVEFSNGVMGVKSSSAGNVPNGYGFIPGTISNVTGTVNYTQYARMPPGTGNYSWFVYKCHAIGTGTCYMNWTYTLVKNATLGDCTEVQHDISFSITEEPVVNDPPVANNPSPTHTQTGVAVDVGSVSVSINDAEGDTFDWSIEVSTGNSNSGNDDTNGTKSCTLGTLSYSTTYTWWVNMSDYTGDNPPTNRTYTFTTESAPATPGHEPPYITDIYPVDAQYIPYSYNVQIRGTIHDVDSTTLYVTFYGWNYSTSEWVNLSYQTSSNGSTVSYMWSNILGSDYDAMEQGLSYEPLFSWDMRVSDGENYTDYQQNFLMREPNFILFDPEPVNASVNQTPYTKLSCKAYQESGGNITVRFYTGTNDLIGITSVDAYPYDVTELSIFNDYAVNEDTSYTWYCNGTLTTSGGYTISQRLPSSGHYTYTTMEYDPPDILFVCAFTNGTVINDVNVTCPVLDLGGLTGSQGTDGWYLMQFSWSDYYGVDWNTKFDFYFKKEGFKTRHERYSLPDPGGFDHYVIHMSYNLSNQLGNTSGFWNLDFLDTDDYGQMIDNIIHKIQGMPSWIGILIMLGAVLLVAMGSLGKMHNPMAMGIGIVSILILGTLLGWLPWWVIMVTIFAGALGGYAFFSGKLPGLSGGG